MNGVYCYSLLLILQPYLSTSDLQFGFKSDASTASCMGRLKNTIALHIHRKTKVFGCFLDVSKVFDRVSHNTLFSVLEKRDVPPTFSGLGTKTSLALLNGILVFQTPLV